MYLKTTMDGTLCWLGLNILSLLYPDFGSTGIQWETNDAMTNIILKHIIPPPQQGYSYRLIKYPPSLGVLRLLQP